MVNAALRLCEIGGAARQDPRVRLAAARLRESAANTPEFRAAIPRVQTLLANSSEDWPELNAALLHAAMDGVPGLDPEAFARASGVLTEWRIVGPLGRHPLLDFDQLSISPNDDLTQASYDNRAVENFQFPDGIISLPPYLPTRGIFYAAGHFASLAAGAWTVRFESAGALEIYVDGKRVLRQDASLRGTRVHGSATVDVAAGPHRVLAKFAGVRYAAEDCSIAFDLGGIHSSKGQAVRGRAGLRSGCGCLRRRGVWNGDRANQCAAIGFTFGGAAVFVGPVVGAQGPRGARRPSGVESCPIARAGSLSCLSGARRAGVG